MSGGDEWGEGLGGERKGGGDIFLPPGSKAEPGAGYHCITDDVLYSLYPLLKSRGGHAKEGLSLAPGECLALACLHGRE